MKSYTDLEQSKKLAEILPIESADMCFNTRNKMPPLMTPYSRFNDFYDISPTPRFLIPCWSIAALLSILKYPSLTQDIENKWFITDWTGAYPKSEHGFDNPVDACYEMILKLHELKLL